MQPIPLRLAGVGEGVECSWTIRVRKFENFSKYLWENVHFLQKKFPDKMFTVKYCLTLTYVLFMSKLVVFGWRTSQTKFRF